MYSEEWNLRTNGRIALITAGGLLEVLGFLESGSSSRYFRAAGKTSVGLSSTMTPQSTKRDTIAGSKIMLGESTGALTMRFLIGMDVVADADSAPHPGDGVGVAGIELGKLEP